MSGSMLGLEDSAGMRLSTVSPNAQDPILERCLGSQRPQGSWYFLVASTRIALNSCCCFRKHRKDFRGCVHCGGITHVTLISANGEEV